jgi:hypothetical protein
LLLNYRLKYALPNLHYRFQTITLIYLNIYSKIITAIDPEVFLLDKVSIIYILMWYISISFEFSFRSNWVFFVSIIHFSTITLLLLQLEIGKLNTLLCIVKTLTYFGKIYIYGYFYAKLVIFKF